MQQLTPGSEAQNYARAVRARLLAHNAAHSLHTATPQRQAQATVDTLLRTMGYDVASLNAAVTQERKPDGYSSRPQDGPATFALREQADMIYHNRDLTLLKAAKGL